ncbi:MAG: 4-hydroxy-tetrahydrodipicolinate reductase [Chlamydiia bacterium]|nr:4-hydroxy-tetrahydrodipicolinate reductase [Chlamydiia bacterium]
MGASGKVGKALVSQIKQDQDLTLYKALNRPNESFDGADVVIDFSNASCFRKTLELCCESNTPLVSGTTALAPEDSSLMKEANIPILHSTNFSIGIALIKKFLKEERLHLQKGYIDIIETHDISKVDTPSGTSLSLAENFEQKNVSLGTPIARGEEDLVISSLRRKGSKGSHDVVIDLEDETLTLSHMCHSRSAYARGALLSAKFIITKESGFYTFSSVFQPNQSCSLLF